MNQFVMIPHQWYSMNNNNSFIGKLGQKRFALWFILNKTNLETGYSNNIQVQIKQIHSKYKHLSGFSKQEYIRKMLIELSKVGLIKCENLNIKTKPSELLMVEIVKQDYTMGYSAINLDIFNDKIHELDAGGFFVYCFLFKYHNIYLGNQDEYQQSSGYAEVSRQTIANVLNIKSERTITKYLNNIRKAKELIKTLDQEYYETVNEFGETVREWRPNRYIVHAKCNHENKYYIQFGKQ